MPDLTFLTTVDSTPVDIKPPSSTMSTLPSNTFSASSALLSDGLHEIFALDPNRDPPDFEMRSNVSFRPGILRPIIFSGPTTCGGSGAREETTMVNGPGQNRKASASTSPLISPSSLALPSVL